MFFIISLSSSFFWEILFLFFLLRNDFEISQKKILSFFIEIWLRFLHGGFSNYEFIRKKNGESFIKISKIQNMLQSNFVCNQSVFSIFYWKNISSDHSDHSWRNTFCKLKIFKTPFLFDSLFKKFIKLWWNFYYRFPYRTIFFLFQNFSFELSHFKWKWLNFWFFTYLIRLE